MADTALVNMTASSGLAATDLFYTIKDPGGTPLDRKLTGTQLATFAWASPTLVTPVLGVATATSINGLTITATTGGVLTIPNSVTLTGPAASGTAMTLGNAEAVSGIKTFATGQIVNGTLRLGTVSSVTGQLLLANSASANLTTIQAGNAAAARTYTWPTNFGASGTVLTDAGGDGTLSWAAGSGTAVKTMVRLFPQNISPSSTVYSTNDTMTGASTPAESIPVLDFDDTAVEYADFYCIMPTNYANGGITVTIVWSAAQATNKGVWEAAFRLVASNGTDLDTTAFTYDYNTTGDIDPPTTVGKVVYNDITFTNGADMDSVVASSYFIFRVRRPAPSGTKITGDCSIHAIHIKET